MVTRGEDLNVLYVPTLRLEYERNGVKSLTVKSEQGYPKTIATIAVVKQPFGSDLYKVTSDERLGLYADESDAIRAVAHRALLDYCDRARPAPKDEN